jgi:hypothetical protein
MYSAGVVICSGQDKSSDQPHDAMKAAAAIVELMHRHKFGVDIAARYPTDWSRFS